MRRDETVEWLAGGIAHDFDGLLSAIVGHADNRSDYLSPADPRAAEVAAIRHAAETASALTRQLLAFSRRNRCARGSSGSTPSCNGRGLRCTGCSAAV